MKATWIILVLFISRNSFAQSSPAEKDTRSGNEFYKQQQFDKAASAYSKAIEADPGNGTAKFNLGNTLFKQNKPDEAVKIFDEVAAHTGKADLKPGAYYNKGVVFSQQKKLEESIEAYKSALRLHPEDKETRENLQKALLELKKKNPPKKKNEQEKKKKQQDQQQKQPQSKMSPKEAQQRLQLLAQKEKEVQQRIQKDKSKSGGSQTKDW